jgi:molybdate transport system substrate-binding protein
MRLIKLKLMVISLLLFSLIAVGCKNTQSETIELNIAAASDLTLAFTEVSKVFEEETGIKITFSFGSTGQLADQIEHGAPFDVFAAANKQFIEQLDEKELVISDTKMLYALGRIGLATKVDQQLKIETLEQLVESDVVKVAIANPDHAPYGLAAKQALQNAGLWETIEDKLVFGRNISDTLAFLETGNVEVAIIALSLVKEDEVNFTLIDDQLHAPLEQMIAVIKQTKQEEQARAFIDFIRGTIGKPIMESYGFVVPVE